jgi:hypothetical protein
MILTLTVAQAFGELILYMSIGEFLMSWKFIISTLSS